MEHLWRLGHRRYAYLGPIEEERGRRFRAWLALAGGPSPAVFDTDDRWGMEAGYAAMGRLLQTPREAWPTAVVAACDSLAVGALRGTRTRRRRPGQSGRGRLRRYDGRVHQPAPHHRCRAA